MYTAKIKLDNKETHILKKEKLLTIGIITKNECEKLERCLKSLMPIKQAVDCEIILTDTGSTDGTIEMAEKYVDKIINFEWCDDFAAARNTGIDASKGMWFMWIDSDEWVENAEGLIEFFRSEDYRNYLSASIKLKDYSSVEHDIYRELDLFRLAILFEKTRFEGKIHESIPISYPVKSLELDIFHDGYIFETKEARDEKHKRNLTKLLEEYDKNPENINTIRYIVDQYRFSNELEKAIEYCDRGIELIKKNKGNLQGREHISKIHFLLMKALSYFEKEEYESAIETLEQIEDTDPKASYLFIDIYATLAFSYKSINNKEKESYYAQKYIDYYIKQDEFDKAFSVFFFNFSNNNLTLKRMLVSSLENQNNNAKFEDIFNLVEALNSKNSTNKSSDKDYIDQLWILADKFKEYNLIAEVYEKITSGHIEITLDYFEKEIYKYMIANQEAIREISLHLSKLNIDNQYIRINKIISENYNQNQSNARMLINEYLHDSETEIKEGISSELIYNAIKHNIGIESITRKIDVFKTGDYIKSMPTIHDDFYECVSNYYKKYESEINSLRGMYFIVALLEVSFTDNLEENMDKVHEFYEILGEILPKLIYSMYNKEYMDENNIDVYPPLFRFGYYTAKANEYKNDGNIVEYMKMLKKSLENYTIMEIPIRDIINEIDSKNKRQLEFEELASGVKKKIYELITIGDKEEALSVVCQLQSLMPEDKELKELKSRLSIK